MLYSETKNEKGHKMIAQNNWQQIRMYRGLITSGRLNHTYPMDNYCSLYRRTKKSS